MSDRATYLAAMEADASSPYTPAAGTERAYERLVASIDKAQVELTAAIIARREMNRDIAILFSLVAMLALGYVLVYG